MQSHLVGVFPIVGASSTPTFLLSHPSFQEAAGESESWMLGPGRALKVIESKLLNFEGPQAHGELVAGMAW